MILNILNIIILKHLHHITLTTHSTTPCQQLRVNNQLAAMDTHHHTPGPHWYRRRWLLNEADLTGDAVDHAIAVCNEQFLHSVEELRLMGTSIHALEGLGFKKIVAFAIGNALGVPPLDANLKNDEIADRDGLIAKLTAEATQNAQIIALLNAEATQNAQIIALLNAKNEDLMIIALLKAKNTCPAAAAAAGTID